MLFWKELKKICFSLTYLLFFILLVFGWYQNFYGLTKKEIAAAADNGTAVRQELADGSILRKPDEKAKSYGTKNKEVPDKIMMGGTDKLIGEYLNHSYAVYPFGYYKEIVLSQSEQSVILDILRRITGLTEEQLQNLPDDYFPAVNGNIIHYGGFREGENGEFIIDGTKKISDRPVSGDKTEHFVSQVSYEEFKQLMKQVEKILGPGSSYSMEMLITYYGLEDMDYEEALEEYNKVIHDDKVSTAFARLFCDFMARPLGLYPVFIAAAIWLKDRSSRMDQVIGCRAAGTVKILLARYTAVLAAVIVPVILFSFESLIPLLGYSAENGIIIDASAFIKYILWWLLPTVMAVTALGMFLTVSGSALAAVTVQAVWWFVDAGVTGLSGDTGLFTLMVRHNTLRGSELIRENFSIICINRGLLVLFAAGLLVLTCVIYEKKRRGKLSGGCYGQKYRSIFKKRFPAVF